MTLKYKGKKCIVTGGAGFIGQHIVKRLLSEGADVFLIDNFLFGTSEESVNKNAHLIKGDVRDPNTLQKLPSIHYDFLFHFAAPSSTILFDQDLAECVDITIRGFLTMIKYAADNGIRFVYPSTGSLYSGIEPPHHEKAQLNYGALNTYAKCKVELENIASIYWPKIHSLGLRILAGYGPGEFHKGKFQSVIYSFCYNMFHGNSPVIWGDGSQRRDFVFIEDIVSAALALALNCEEPLVNIGTGEDISFKEVVKVINKHLPKKVEPNYIPRPQLYLDKTLAHTDLLKKYYKNKFTTVSEGVELLINSFKKNIK